MKRTTRILACVWLGLALLGALAAAWLIQYLGTEDLSGDMGALRQAVAICLASGLTLFWVIPLTVATVLLLGRRVLGWTFLCVHAGLGTAVWLFACYSMLSENSTLTRSSLIHLPGGGSVHAGAVMGPSFAALLALSIFTVVALLRDRPNGWRVEADSPASPESTEVAS